MGKKKLHIVYIVPSRYDDEGYVQRYWRGVLPSNTLWCLKSLTCAIGDAGELGEDVETIVDIYDDSVQRVPVQRLIRRSKRTGARLVIGLIAVQTNQFPRATELALEFRAADVPVMVGGFHVSGVLALFGEPSPELQRLLDHGVSFVRGEVDAPGVLAGILRDALNGSLKPIYDIVETPDISDAAIPQPDRAHLRRFVWKNLGTMDTSRGCPFNCSFCTIINVQGRKMRHRSAASMLKSIEENYARGIDTYFFTDDNLARSPVWEELFDGLARFRRRGMQPKFLMQVDTQAWRIPRFIEKAAAAGCHIAFIGMETINPDNIAATGKRQNKINEFAQMMEAWHRAKILVHAGYIIGLPHDTAESVRREVAVLKDALKVDQTSFFMLTPLPGSRDHLQMVQEAVPLDADLNNYDSFHETFRHPNMGPGEWHALYNEAWDTFYSKESIVNILLRNPANRYWQLFWLLLWNRYSTLLRTHPMITGFVRLKDRKGRRPTFPQESLPRYAWRRTKDLARFAMICGRLFFEFQEIWLLTRKREDARWAALADLRHKWAEVQQRVRESALGDRCDVAAQELHTMLRAASERITQLTNAGRTSSRGVRRQLERKTREIDNYLRTFELQMPSWPRVAQAERYVSENLLAGYEELAIRYVAKRRQFNAYRRELIDRLKTGRILTMNVGAIPRVIFFELALAARFGFAFFTQI